MLDDIRWIHVEPTTRCNAWCSSCSRNKNGYGLTDFKLQDLSVERLNQVIKKLPNLKTVQFCGTLGDPCASKLIDEQLQIVKEHNLEIQIHTNGSLRSKEWWHNLSAKFGNKLHVWFAIDGLEDTHKIYRQGTYWKKIMENAKAFIDNGGYAIWQFIPFAHNEHQIKECMQLANKIGFKKFEFVKNARYPKNAFDYKTGIPVDIKPWSRHSDQWVRKGKILDKKTTAIKKTKVQTRDCMYLALSSLFLNASGVITPCCYFREKPLVEGEIEKSIKTQKFFGTCLDNCGS
jgi:MoaA/NifB/PqqE/SkfB family radical SAM enzyme